MYKRLDDEAYTRLRKSLLKKEAEGWRRDFLASALSNEDFLDFMQDVRTTKAGKEKLDVLGRLTESEYNNPPDDTERDLYEKWKDVPPETACRVTFWGEVTLNHIERGAIQACYLAAGTDTARGVDRIRKVLSGNGDIDSCVRTILRNMSGIPEARGNISVYVNCPFSRAWWRVRLAHEVYEMVKIIFGRKDPNNFEKIVRLLRWKNEGWETIMRWVISRNSVLGDTKTRDLLVWILAEKLSSTEPKTSFTLLESVTIRKICRVLGVRCAWQELSMLDVEELRDVIEKDLFLATKAAAK